jgi:hypothetical protein
MTEKHNNIILQHFDGELRDLDKLSIANIQKYASKVGADYELITGKPFRDHLTSPCQKVYMLSEEWDSYEQVLMLDIDMFVPTGMEKNVFEESGIGLYNPIQRNLHKGLFNQYKKQSSMSSPYWGGAIYKFSKFMRKALREFLGGNEDWMKSYNKPYHFEDEGIIHTLATKAGIEWTSDMNLDPKWCYDNYLSAPEDAYMIHIRTKIGPNGPKQEKIKNFEVLASRGIL